MFRCVGDFRSWLAVEWQIVSIGDLEVNIGSIYIWQVGRRHRYEGIKERVRSQLFRKSEIYCALSAFAINFHIW
jgi:hypothetical protein